MKEGIYALASLDGAPLAPEDLRAMGLAEVDGVLRAEGFAGRVVDRQGAAIATLRTPDQIILLLGFLDEPEELAGTLGVERKAAPAALAAAALERFGSEAPAHMLGEWTLLAWRVRERELTLLASESRRDTIFFHQQGSRLAIAPEMLRLAGLDGARPRLDPVALAMWMSRAGLRHRMTDATLWQGVRQLMPGACERFSAAGRRTQRLAEHDPPELWTGSFDEGVEALEAVLRRMMRQTMARHGRIAAMLSGGLDSSTLATLAALERGPGRELFCVSSAAPPGSGIPDETEFSIAAAQALGLDQKLVCPPLEWSLYLPSAAAFDYAESPLISARAPTYTALYLASLAGGATAVLDGVLGEHTLTVGLELPETRSRARIAAANLRDGLLRRRARGGWPEKAFHLRFSKQLLERLPSAWAPIWRKGPPAWVQAGPDQAMGVSPVLKKNSIQATATPEGIRHLVPFRDRRLARLTSRFPGRFGLHEGLSRPLARRLLLGRMPDSVRLRVTGMPFSPDYIPRMRRQTGEAQARLNLYREAGVGGWIDLAWLGVNLANVGSGRIRDYGGLYEVQTTVITAEFLLWAVTKSVKLAIA